MPNKSSDFSSPSSASLRWKILRSSLLRRPPAAAVSSSPLQSSDECPKPDTIRVSRKAAGGFNLIPCHPIGSDQLTEGYGSASAQTKVFAGSRDICLSYVLPLEGVPSLVLIRRKDDCPSLNDFEISRRYNIDTTGLVCSWPSEEVLAYFCINNSLMFRSKRILELGSGYGLAGLAIAVASDAQEVVISDGNPHVVDYIQRNISVNAGSFGDTEVKSMTLHWNQVEASNKLNKFDIVVASDCTFFKEHHTSLVRTVRSLLKNSEASQAIFMGPKRGDSLDKFLKEIKEQGLHYELVENYDERIWSLHQKFLQGDDPSWPAYEADHCYPLLTRVTFASGEHLIKD